MAKLDKSSIPKIILDRLGIPNHPNVFWVGRKSLRLTFLSQQQRALNLIWALHETGNLTPETRLTVVGAGLAGLTATFAAKHLGASVTLLESKKVPLHLQRGCQLRFIHPYILDWPEAISATHITNLPCLNWGADMAAEVSNTILEQWAEIENTVKTFYGYEVRRIDTSGGQPRVFAEGAVDNYDQVCDRLILAVGFGLERPLPTVPFLSYWENDNFGRPLITGPMPRRYLVTGCGDGGLIDAIRLRINAFDHAEFVYKLTRVGGLQELKKELPEIDKRVWQRLREDLRIQERVYERTQKTQKNSVTNFDERKVMKRIREDIEGELLEEQYRGLKVPPELVGMLTKQLRDDTVVFLNSPSISPLNLRASILNRFVVFLLRQHGGLKYRAGEVEVLPTSLGQPYRVIFRHDQFPAEDVEVHEVVVRHGPIPIIDRLFPKDIAEACRPGPDDLDDPTREPLYPIDFLSIPQLVALKHKVRLDYAIANSHLAAKEQFDLARYDGFGVGVAHGEVTYTLKPKQIDDSLVDLSTISFNGIPFRFDRPVRHVHRRVKPTKRPYTPITCGLPIMNASHSRAQGRGTLGCFVQLRDSGEPAILTTGAALRTDLAQLGDRICVGERVYKANMIATLDNYVVLIASSPRSSLASGNVEINTIDAAVATLLPNVRFDAGFGNDYPDAAPLKSAFRSSTKDQLELVGARVFKVGSGSGFTRGLIDAVAVKCPISGRGGNYWFDGLFGISGSDSKPFSRPGDTGAVVVRDDGTVLGLVIGASSSLTFACPIEPVLEMLHCDLLLSE